MTCLARTTEPFACFTMGGPRNYFILDVRTHLQSKLGAFFARKEDKDYQDITFLCSKYFQLVSGFRGQLRSIPHRKYFVRAYMRENPRSGGALRVKKLKALLGVA